jgi:hypothetical protein
MTPEERKELVDIFEVMKFQPANMDNSDFVRGMNHGLTTAQWLTANWKKDLVEEIP